VEFTVDIEFDKIASEMGLDRSQVEETVHLLDDGNTVPFITRYRKEQTRGLDEVKIRQIKSKLERLRALGERKRIILKSIGSQGKLTDELAQQILGTQSSKRLEDLYLPYKPKKQTLATKARERGLEPLARTVLVGDVAQDFESQALQFVDAEKDLPAVADVLQGVQYIIAEQFAEHLELRSRLRKIIRRTGQLVCVGLEKDVQGEQLLTTTPAHSRSGSTPPLVTSLPPTKPMSDATSQLDTSSIQVKLPTDLQPDTVSKNSEKLSQVVVVQEAQRDDLKRNRKKAQQRKKLSDAFKDYFDHREALSRIPPHRVLAINRGERAHLLRVKITVDTDVLQKEAEDLLMPTEHPQADFLRNCVQDAVTRLVVPSLEREARRELTEQAEIHAVEVFARNLRRLLLQQPVSGRRVIALDPGFRGGCKLAVVDEFGNVLSHDVIHIIGNEERCKAGREKLVAMIQQHRVSVVAIGNGTACRETETLVADILRVELAESDVAYVIVNEAGASVYSTSPLGREELPQFDATMRSAVSIARRLLDPLSELVKINPANIGVGLYQHDVKAKHLRDSLDAVVESCVNYVGVDLNTASPSLLRYVSGLNQLTARRVVEYRQQHGPFHSRETLKQVPGLGDAAFVQSAGFLKITDGENPLDTTWIHPESFDVAQRVLEKLGSSPDELFRRRGSGDDSDGVSTNGETESPLAEGKRTSRSCNTVQLANQIGEIERDQFARELQIGRLLLDDILQALLRPGRDPREDLPQPVFRREILKLEDLKPGMELTGTVLNVVDFGVFVDIGLHDSGLIHISCLADRYIRDPHEVVSVADVIKVWVVEVDKKRRRVSLTAIKPGTEKPVSQRNSGKQAQRTKQTQRTGHGKPASNGNAQKSRAKSERKTHSQSKRQSRSAVPITKEMQEGKEPMRTFGDLKQFYDKESDKK